MKKTTNVDDVQCCVNQLDSDAEKDRVMAAQALEFFVCQADDSNLAANVAFTALVQTIVDSSLKVRRAAAHSLQSLALEFPMPEPLQRQLQAVVGEDKVVMKRIALTLKRARRSNNKSNSFGKSTNSKIYRSKS